MEWLVVIAILAVIAYEAKGKVVTAAPSKVVETTAIESTVPGNSTSGDTFTKQTPAIVTGVPEPSQILSTAGTISRFGFAGSVDTPVPIAITSRTPVKIGTPTPRAGG